MITISKSTDARYWFVLPYPIDCRVWVCTVAMPVHAEREREREREGEQLWVRGQVVAEGSELMFGCMEF
jgi:hypothetical protein